MKAVWNNKVIANSENTVFIEGNHYFPPSSISKEYYSDSELTTECFWKGTANYFSLIDGESTAKNAAWYYAIPKDGSVKQVGHDFANFVAFYPNIVSVS